MAEGSPANFGVAEVRLRVRLDELNRQLDQAEMEIGRRTEQINASRDEAMRGIARTSEESDRSLGGAAIGVLELIGLWQTLSGAVKIVRIAIMSIPAAVAAVKVAAVGAAAAAVLGIGLIVEAAESAKRAAGDIIAAFNEMDGSEQKAREFADQLERIPILGGAISNTFRLFSKDANQSTEIMTGWVATVEDGQVKVGLLGRAVSGVVKSTLPGWIARVTGLMPDFIAQIEEANERIAEMQEAANIRTEFQPTISQVADESTRQRVQAERELAMQGLEGVEAVRMAEKFRHEDAMAQFVERRNALNSELSAAKSAIQADEDLGAKEKAQQIAVATMTVNQQLANLERDRIATSEQLNMLALRRVAAARSEAIQQKIAGQEQQRQTRLRRQEQQRQTRLRNETTVDTLRTDTEASELELQGRDFEARALRLEARRRAAIRQARSEGRQVDIDLINKFYDSRKNLIAKREAEHRDQLAEEAEREAEQREQDQIRIMQTNEELRSMIREERLRQSGDEVGAQIEAIERDFQSRIDRALGEGNTEGAGLLRRLRDLEINDARSDQSSDQVAKQQDFRQVSLSRTAFDSTKQEDEQVRLARSSNKRLDEIARNTRNPTPAVAA